MKALATLLALAAFSLIGLNVARYVLSPTIDAQPPSVASAQLSADSRVIRGNGGAS